MPPFNTNKIGGPPPGSTPQGLSSIPFASSPREELLGGGLGEAMPQEGGSGGGLKDVFDEVQSVLDALASILPESAEELDDIKLRLSEILAKAISGGASFRGRSGSGIESPAKPEFPV